MTRQLPGKRAMPLPKAAALAPTPQSKIKTTRVAVPAATADRIQAPVQRRYSSQPVTVRSAPATLRTQVQAKPEKSRFSGGFNTYYFQRTEANKVGNMQESSLGLRFAITDQVLLQAGGKHKQFYSERSPYQSGFLDPEFSVGLKTRDEMSDWYKLAAEIGVQPGVSEFSSKIGQRAAYFQQVSGELILDDWSFRTYQRVYLYDQQYEAIDIDCKTDSSGKTKCNHLVNDTIGYEHYGSVGYT